MSAYECWCEQREKLRASLKTCEDASGAAYLTRHALAQVEQNTMAGQTDDLLRQQTGILFACCKASVNLLDISVTTKVWVAQSESRKPPRAPGLPLLLIAAALQLGAGLYAYGKGLTLLWAAMAGALVLTVAGLVAVRRRPRAALPDEDHLKVTAKPDAERLFSALDGQMKMIDRYINDFAYLNQQSLLKQETPDSRNVRLMAELMETLYDAEGEEREAAVAAANHMMEGLGMRAVDYSPESSGLFTVLPSKTDTRTLAPAIVALKDGQLLRRGTAATMQVAVNA